MQRGDESEGEVSRTRVEEELCLDRSLLSGKRGRCLYVTVNRVAVQGSKVGGEITQ